MYSFAKIGNLYFKKTIVTRYLLVFRMKFDNENECIGNSKANLSLDWENLVLLIF